MRYEAFHICKPSTFIESLKALEGSNLIELHPSFYTGTREAASALAKHYGGATIIPVQLFIAKPFINTPHDPFVELGRFYEQLPGYQVLAIAGRFEHLLTNTNRWEELKELHGESLTLQSLYSHNLEDFLTLPLEVRELVEDNAMRNIVSGMGYDGFIYGGMAPAEGEVIYYPLNTAAIRYGSEEAVC